MLLYSKCLPYNFFLLMFIFHSLIIPSKDINLPPMYFKVLIISESYAHKSFLCFHLFLLNPKEIATSLVLVLFFFCHPFGFTLQHYLQAFLTTRLEAKWGFPTNTLRGIFAPCLVFPVGWWAHGSQTKSIFLEAMAPVPSSEHGHKRHLLLTYSMEKCRWITRQSASMNPV